MADEKVAADKRGLHGWRAAAAVFGCGSLAAFGFFGALLGFVSLFLDVSSNGIDSPPQDPGPILGQSAIPRDSIETGAIDLCGGTIPGVDEVQATRIDSGGSYNDPGEGEAPRTVTDECSWNVFAAGGPTNLTMDFSYEAFISDENGDDAGGLADSRFAEIKSEIESPQMDSMSSGDAVYADEAYYVHGLTDVGSTSYAMVLRSGDTVYEMNFESDRDFPSGELISASIFENEIENLVSYIEVRLGVVGPQ